MCSLTLDGGSKHVDDEVLRKHLGGLLVGLTGCADSPGLRTYSREWLHHRARVPHRVVSDDIVPGGGLLPAGPGEPAAGSKWIVC